MAFLIDPVLREDAPQIHLSGLGRAIGLLARTSRQLLRAHRGTGAVGTDVKHRGIARGALLRAHFPLLPNLGTLTDALHQALDLPCRNSDAARLVKGSPIRARVNK